MVKTMGGTDSNPEGSKTKKRKRVQVADNKYPVPPDDPAHMAVERPVQPRPVQPRPGTTPAESSAARPAAPPQAPAPPPQQPVPVPNPLTPAHQSALSKFVPAGTQPREPIYNFDHVYRISLTRDTEKWIKIRNAKVAKPLYPVHDDLRTMEIFDEVASILTEGNLEYIMWDDPGIYQKLVIEFISTLQVIWATSDGPESMLKPGSKRWAHRWIFQINGFFHSLTEAEFEKIFKYQWKETSYTNQSSDEDNQFWRYITENPTITFATNSASNLIRLPAWRIIHRLVAENLVTRADKGTRVNHRDLEIMRTLRRGKGKGVKLMTIFSDLFEKCLSSSVLGGGAIITLIAKHLGYNLDSGKPLQPNKLGLAMMKNSLMIDKENNWVKEPLGRKKGKEISAASPVAPVTADGDVAARLKAIEESQAEIIGNVCKGTRSRNLLL